MQVTEIVKDRSWIRHIVALTMLVLLLPHTFNLTLVSGMRWGAVGLCIHFLRPEE